MDMRINLSILALSCLLSGCLLPGELFYIGQLSDHDQGLFRDAARIEDVETVDWPAPGALVVVYGTPTHDNGLTIPATIFLDSQQRDRTNCMRDQAFIVISRHEIGHTNGKNDSTDPD